MTHYDLVVIGAGPGGYVAAIKAAQLGMKVALVEGAQVGGTCLNRGCIPTKTLLHTAEVYQKLRRGAPAGLSVEGARIDYDALRSHTADVVEKLRTGLENLIRANGITLIYGYARVPKEHCIEVSCRVAPAQEDVAKVQKSTDTKLNDNSVWEECSTHTKTLEADHIIVATGSKPIFPNLEGIHLKGVYTSDTMLATIPRLQSLVIVGAGVIGMEFAGLYTALGSDVCVLASRARVLPKLERDVGQNLAMIMKKRGCGIVSNARATSFERTDNNTLRINYTHKDTPQSIEAEAVLLSCGRTPEVAEVFSAAYMPALEHGRIVVDRYMETSLKDVYAIGDVAASFPQLAHAASAEGIVAACACANTESTLNLSCIPSCVYVSPEIACVGMDEARAKEAGIQAHSVKFSLATNGKSLITGQDRSFIKLVADHQMHIIGAQLMCGRATDMVGEMSTAIACGLTVEQMASVIRPHPTFEEAIGDALGTFMGQSIHTLPPRKSQRTHYTS